MNRCWNNARTVPPCAGDIVGGDCWAIVPHRPNSSLCQGHCWGIVHALARWAWKGPGSCVGGPRHRFSSFLIVCPSLRPARLRAPPLAGCPNGVRARCNLGCDWQTRRSLSHSLQFHKRLAGATRRTQSTRARNRLAWPNKRHTQREIGTINFNPALTESDRRGLLVDGLYTAPARRPRTNDFRLGATLR